MLKADNLEALFRGLLRLPSVSNNSDILEYLVQKSRELEIPEPIREVLNLQQAKSKKLSKQIESLPLGEEGKFLTIDEIHGLGLGYDTDEISAILQKQAQNFLKEDTGNGTATVKYKVGYNNVFFLDKRGIISKEWESKFSSLRFMIIEGSRLSVILRNLESRLSEQTVQAEDISPENIPQYLVSPQRMTVKNILEAGTSLTSGAYISQKINAHREELEARKEGIAWVVTVNSKNYKLLGLPGIQQKPDREKPGKDEKNKKPDLNDNKKMLPDGPIPLAKLKLYSSYHPMHLSRIIAKNPDKFRREKSIGRGSPIIVYLKNENQALLRLNKIPGELSIKAPLSEQTPKNDALEHVFHLPARRKTAVTFEIEGKHLTFNYDSQYLAKYAGEMLRKIHSGVFTDKAISRALQFMDSSDGKIDGDRLIAFFETVNGIMSLSSKNTQQKLETLLGERFEDLSAGSFTRPNVKKLIYTLPEVIEGAFILKNEIQAVKDAIASSQATLNEPEKILDLETLDEPRRERVERYHSEFRQKGIMPPSPGTYSKLLSIGILSQSSIPGIHISYRRYERKMRGWETFDFNASRTRLTGLTWNDFVEEFINPFIASGIIKDMVREYNEANQWFNYYVIKAGHRENLRESFRSKSAA